MKKLLLLAFFFACCTFSVIGQTTTDSLLLKLEVIQPEDSVLSFDSIDQYVDSLRKREYILEVERQREAERRQEEIDRKAEQVRAKRMITELERLDSLIKLNDYKEINRLYKDGYFEEIQFGKDSISKGVQVELNSFKYIEVDTLIENTSLENLHKSHELIFQPLIMLDYAIQIPSIRDNRNNLQEYAKELLHALKFVFTEHSSTLNMTFLSYQKLESKKNIPSLPVKTQIDFRYKILKICIDEIND